MHRTTQLLIQMHKQRVNFIESMDGKAHPLPFSTGFKLLIIPCVAESSTSEVLHAQILQVLDCYTAVTIAVQYLQVAFDVSAARRKYTVEAFVGVDDHRYNLDTVNVSVTIAIIRIQDLARNIASAFLVGQSRVDQDGGATARRSHGITVSLKTGELIHQISIYFVGFERRLNEALTKDIISLTNGYALFLRVISHNYSLVKMDQPLSSTGKGILLGFRKEKRCSRCPLYTFLQVNFLMRFCLRGERSLGSNFLIFYISIFTCA